MNDVARIRNGQHIRLPKNKSNMLQDKPIKSCLSRFDSGAYIRLQFLSAVSHFIARTRSISSDRWQQQLQQRRRGHGKWRCFQ